MCSVGDLNEGALLVYAMLTSIGVAVHNEACVFLCV